jgi:sugar phosphate permease
MVGAGFGIQLLAAGLLMQSFGAYVAVLQDDFGWSRAALAGAFSLLMLIGGIMGPFQGAFIDRYGPRALMRLGLVLFGLGFMAMSQINSIAGYYAVYVVIAIGFRLGVFFPLSVAIVNWFERWRARALSTMSLGMAVGGLFVPVVAASLETFGWRSTAFVSGLLIIILGLPLAQLIRHRPEDYGETVDGVPDEPATDAAESSEAIVAPVLRAERDMTLKEAVRTPAFWLICLGHGSALLVVNAVKVHLINHLKQDLGYSVSGAALVVTLMTAVQMCAILLGGWLGDRFNKRMICAGCMFMHAIGMLLVTYSIALPMVVGFAVLHGAAWGLRGPLMQAIRADYFGRSSFGAIMGFSAFIIMFFQVLGPLIVGALADASGNYELGFTAMALAAGFGSVFFFAAKKPSRPAPVVEQVATST